jgi:hypothetical protein
MYCVILIILIIKVIILSNLATCKELHTRSCARAHSEARDETQSGVAKVVRSKRSKRPSCGCFVPRLTGQYFLVEIRKTIVCNVLEVETRWRQLTELRVANKQ